MLPKFQKILFATDLSSNSDFALIQALGFAKLASAEVIVVHVLEPLSTDAVVTMNMFVQDKITRDHALKERHATYRQMLKDNQKAVRQSLSEDERSSYDAVSAVELIEGGPAEVILRRAEELSCDLIVMGSHDHGGGQTFLGTIAKRVLRRSHVPTLIVPKR